MTDAGLDAAAVTADLRSGDTERIARALRELDDAWPRMRTVPLPLPTPDCLDAFDSFHAPEREEMLALYLSVLQGYSNFEPTPSGTELQRAMVEAVIRHGRGEQTLPVALALGRDDFPDYAVSHAMRHIADRRLDTPGEARAAHHLLDYLLDDARTRGATVDGLRLWAMSGVHPEVVEALRPRLDETELRRIAVDEDDEPEPGQPQRNVPLI